VGLDFSASMTASSHPAMPARNEVPNPSGLIQGSLVRKYIRYPCRRMQAKLQPAPRSLKLNRSVEILKCPLQPSRNLALTQPPQVCVSQHPSSSALSVSPHQPKLVPSRVHRAAAALPTEPSPRMRSPPPALESLRWRPEALPSRSKPASLSSI
jgi:hypothetical protein